MIYLRITWQLILSKIPRNSQRAKSLEFQGKYGLWRFSNLSLQSKSVHHLLQNILQIPTPSC